MRKRHWFLYVSNGILALFLSIIAIVIWIAFMRPSGFTGLDMAAMQKMRYESNPGNLPSPLKSQKP